MSAQVAPFTPGSLPPAPPPPDDDPPDDDPLELDADAPPEPLDVLEGPSPDVAPLVDPLDAPKLSPVVSRVHADGERTSAAPPARAMRRSDVIIRSVLARAALASPAGAFARRA